MEQWSVHSDFLFHSAHVRRVWSVIGRSHRRLSGLSPICVFKLREITVSNLGMGDKVWYANGCRSLSLQRPSFVGRSATLHPRNFKVFGKHPACDYPQPTRPKDNAI